MGIMMIRLRFFLQIYVFYLILRKVKFKVFEDEKRYNLYSRRSDGHTAVSDKLRGGK